MLRDTPCKPDQKLRVDEDWMEFSLAPEGTKVSPRTFHKTLVSCKQLGDYGHFSSRHFHRQGNIFVDIQSLVSEVDIAPRQQEVTTGIKNVANLQSLPINRAFNSSLASLSSRLTNAYLVTRVVQCISESKFRARPLGSLSDCTISFQLGHW